ncbi:hypothetical protein KFE94_13950 [bacterium SCSIO 12643]|nr:hypothetical protein KFE94_13950 [bacterium SCSIO 12643]
MSFNTIGYLIYIPITIFITVYVGKQCHTHGIHYVKPSFANEEIAIAVNNMLLVGYYLVNIGYAVIRIQNWEYISSFTELYSSISTHVGQIIMLLALLHYINISGLSLFRTFNKSIIQ